MKGLDRPEELGGAGATLTLAPPRGGVGHAPAAYERWLKPAMDRTAAAVLILLFGPVLLLILAAVWLTLGSPVLLRQERIGLHGRPFGVLKVRTMHPDRRRRSLQIRGPERRVHHKVPHDPRLTPLGRFLRSWSLDELPQLFNVLLGDMSLVGPRPEMVAIVERYESWQHRRHQVKPGITGLWQVTARGDAPMHELTEVDLDYVDQISFLTDLKILVLTVPAVLGLRRGF